MYCTICGNLLSDKDIFCKICGTATGVGMAKETQPVNTIGEEKSTVAVEERQAIEEERQNIEIMAPEETKLEEKPTISNVDPEISWNVYEFPKPKKTEDMEFVWKTEDTYKPSLTLEKTSEKKLEEILFQELDTLKNEEIEECEEDVLPLDSDTFFTFSKKNEEFQKLLDREYEKIKDRENSDPRMIREIQGDGTGPFTIPEKPEESFQDNIVVEKEKETVLETVPDAPEAIEPETIEPEAMAPVEPLIQPIIQGNEALRKKFDTKEISCRGERGSASIKISQVEKIAEIPESEPLREEDPLAVIFDQEPIVEKKEQKPKRLSFPKVLLIILIIALVAELVCLGIQQFAPQSSAAQAITKQQVMVVEQIKSWVDKIKGTESGAEQNQSSNSTPQDADVDVDEIIAPTIDKGILIANNADKNTNIKWLVANDQLKYIEGKNYGVSDINNSKPMENCFWSKSEDGTVKYYDNEIVGTLMAFNSQWVDYVNDGNKSVLALTEVDSQAYKNAINFENAGKMNLTFNLLEIGEIRKGEKGYYVWCHTEVEISENATTTQSKYNWIYYLEPKDSGMKMINYYKF